MRCSIAAVSRSTGTRTRAPRRSIHTRPGTVDHDLGDLRIGRAVARARPGRRRRPGRRPPAAGAGRRRAAAPPRRPGRRPGRPTGPVAPVGQQPGVHPGLGLAQGRHGARHAASGTDTEDTDRAQGPLQRPGDPPGQQAGVDRPGHRLVDGHLGPNGHARGRPPRRAGRAPAPTRSTRTTPDGRTGAASARRRPGSTGAARAATPGRRRPRPGRRRRCPTRSRPPPAGRRRQGVDQSPPPDPTAGVKPGPGRPPRQQPQALAALDLESAQGAGADIGPGGQPLGQAGPGGSATPSTAPASPERSTSSAGPRAGAGEHRGQAAGDHSGAAAPFGRPAGNEHRALPGRDQQNLGEEIERNTYRFGRRRQAAFRGWMERRDGSVRRLRPSAPSWLRQRRGRRA